MAFRVILLHLVNLIIPTSNSTMVDLFGASTTVCPVSEVSITIETVLNDLKKRGYNPYFIPGGGHGDIGTQAYVNAYQEILNYENEKGTHFDYIFHTSGTGTTQAGLICGKLLNENKREIIGMSNARRNPYGSQVILDSVNSYLRSLGVGETDSKNVNFIDDYILDGYGSYNNQVLQTVKEVLLQEGIPMDTTYTGKAFWGMKKYIKKESNSK